MSGFKILNFSPLSSWRSTFQVFFQQLRKTSFASDETFSWETFNPQINFNGMTATGYQLYAAKYVPLNNVFMFSVDLQVTLAAPFTNAIFLTIPNTSPTDPSRAQLIGAYVSVGGVAESGFCGIGPGQNLLALYRAGFANYTAATYRIVCNGVLEVQ